jgi:hypothetical protein
VALLAIFLAPVAVGFWLESRWLTQAGFIVLFLFILGVTGGLGLRAKGREIAIIVSWPSVQGEPEGDAKRADIPSNRSVSLGIYRLPRD